VLLYIHGFNSSALSFKAGVLRKRMVEARRSGEFLCPELPDAPDQAITLLDGLITKHGQQRVALVGSSLGGFYATWLSERRSVPAVLVNPAVRPYELLSGYLGRQTNLYTGAQYDFTERHLGELLKLETDRITPDRYLLMVRTGDEVLNYRDAVERYRGCEQLVIPGGDHGFGDFERYVDIVLAFCAVRSG
jgi:predicted esterase YcpF (UPF0227 family)